MRQRRSARFILVDPQRRVLLIRFDVQKQGQAFSFWATPGGSVESNETDRGAAKRELREELGVTVELTGPVHAAVDRCAHEGVVVHNTDVFFLGRCEEDRISLSGLTEQERGAMRAPKWWTLDEIEQADETIFPTDFGRVIRSLVMAAAGPDSGAS